MPRPATPSHGGPHGATPAALTVAERRPTQVLAARETVALVDSWRRGRLDSDTAFAAHLAELGTDADGLAARLHPSAAPVPGALGWATQFAAIDAHPGPLPALGPVRYGVQELPRLPFPEVYRPLLAWFAERLRDLLSRPDVTLTLSRDATRDLLDHTAGELLTVSLRGLMEARGTAAAGHNAALSGD